MYMYVREREEGGREGGREGGKEGGKEGGREKERERGREGGRERKRERSRSKSTHVSSWQEQHRPPPTCRLTWQVRVLLLPLTTYIHTHTHTRQDWPTYQPTTPRRQMPGTAEQIESQLSRCMYVPYQYKLTRTIQIPKAGSCNERALSIISHNTSVRFTCI